jgi:hypothetical protein
MGKYDNVPIAVVADFYGAVASGWEMGVDACGPVDMDCHIVGVDAEVGAVCEGCDEEHIVDWTHQLILWSLCLAEFTLRVEHHSSIPSI